MSKARPAKYVVGVSECRNFRRCLRKWEFQSGFRKGLSRIGTEQNIHFWFGSAIHFAMEDYHGYNKFGDPRRALKAYYDAFPKDELPDGADDHYDLGLSMLEYYLQWLPKHNNSYGFETLWLDENNRPVPPHTPGARPIVEESTTLDLGIRIVANSETGDIIKEITTDNPTHYGLTHLDGSLISEWDMDDWDTEYLMDTGKRNFLGEVEYVKVKVMPVCFHGTADRLLTDRWGNWYIMDYKTAKGADTNKLDTDDQITRYMWAMEQHFQHPIRGFVYLQLTKEKVKEPRRLKDGTLSTDKKQKTTAAKYRDAIIRDYGEVRKAPSKIVDMLNHLLEQEDGEGDKFIRWDIVERDANQKLSTYHHIIGEAREMCRMDKYLYPTPTRDCIWECSFREACILMDKGEHEEANRVLSLSYAPREKERSEEETTWQKRIKWPEEPITKEWTPEEAAHQDVDKLQMNLILPDEYSHLLKDETDEV